MQEEGYLSAGAGRLHYLKFGSGSNILLAFHGYGSDAGLFRALTPGLGARYTIISVNLPHHGSSRWADGLPLLKEDLVQLVNQLLKTTGQDKISLAGYSLGGRVCLNLIELMPERLDRVVLIAPDGLKPHPFYYFVTRTGLGSRAFRSFLERGEQYSRMAGWLYRHHMLPSRYRFALRYIGTEKARGLLLKVWPAMRFLLPDLKKVKRHIREYRIPVPVFMGRDDRIIPARLAMSFSKDRPEIQVVVLERGHYLFDPDSLLKITRCLL